MVGETPHVNSNNFTGRKKHAILVAVCLTKVRRLHLSLTSKQQNYLKYGNFK